MDDPVEVTLSLLQDKWDAEVVGFRPFFQNTWIGGNQDVPLVTVTPVGEETDTHGYPGKHHYNHFEVRITIWVDDTTLTHKMHRHIKSILVENNKGPTTDYYSAPEVDYILYKYSKDIVDHERSETLYRRDLLVDLKFQDSYS